MKQNTTLFKNDNSKQYLSLLAEKTRLEYFWLISNSTNQKISPTLILPLLRFTLLNFFSTTMINALIDLSRNNNDRPCARKQISL